MKTNKIDLDKLTQEIFEFMFMDSPELKDKTDFVKRQLKIAYMQGRIDGLEEARKIDN